MTRGQEEREMNWLSMFGSPRRKGRGSRNYQECLALSSPHSVSNNIGCGTGKARKETAPAERENKRRGHYRERWLIYLTAFNVFDDLHRLSEAWIQ
jgi:hypothetical protein